VTAIPHGRAERGRRPLGIGFLQRAARPRRREQVRDQADPERHGEALHRSGPERVEDRGGEERGRVRVEQRGEYLRVARAQRGLCVLPGAPLLADALEHEHVRVHRHPGGEGEPGDPGQRERGAHQSERRHLKDQVQRERRRRDDAGAAVRREHERDDERGARRAGLEPAPHGIGPERRADGGLGERQELRGQRAGAQQPHRPGRFREVHADDAAVPLDGAFHDGRELHVAADDDRERLAHQPRGRRERASRARVGEVEAELGRAELAGVDGGLGHVLACELRCALQQIPASFRVGGGPRSVRGVEVGARGRDAEHLVEREHAREPHGVLHVLLQPRVGGGHPHAHLVGAVALYEHGGAGHAERVDAVRDHVARPLRRLGRLDLVEQVDPARQVEPQLHRGLERDEERTESDQGERDELRLRVSSHGRTPFDSVQTSKCLVRESDVVTNRRGSAEKREGDAVGRERAATERHSGDEVARCRRCVREEPRRDMHARQRSSRRARGRRRHRDVGGRGRGRSERGVVRGRPGAAGGEDRQERREREQHDQKWTQRPHAKK
jgi:hypothetical protein